MNKCLIVTGMHRSGTSALAGALGVLGVDLGSNLMPANEDENARGYFEDVELTAFNEALLDHLGYTWDDPRRSHGGAGPRGDTSGLPSENPGKRKIPDRWSG